MENSFLHADIFFFITTIAVVIFSVLLIIALTYLVRILRDIRKVVHTVEEEVEQIKGDVYDARIGIRESSMMKKIKQFLGIKKNKSLPVKKSTLSRGRVKV
jgi:uncharacterized protein YoxC